VVLVINDNSYGLIFALCNMRRSYPYAMLEQYVGFKVAIRRNEVQVKD
jgi:hypothetical protein